MSKHKSYREESRLDYGMQSDDGQNPTLEQLKAGALFRLADGIEQTNRYLGNSDWCSVRHAIVKIANRGITVRHEHSLVFKLHWSIRWPWQQKARRRTRTWKLFKRNAKK